MSDPRSVATDRFAFVIPVHNHPARLAEVVERALGCGHPVFVVDDGSTDATPAVLAGLAGRPGLTVLRHPVNRGKGAALRTGFAAAAEVAGWAIAVDADGQHDPTEAARLIAALPPRPGERPIVVGRRQGMDGPHTPWTSRFGRGFSNFWIAAAGGHRVGDSQSGFRLYPLPEVLQLGARADRFQYEVEVLVLARWRGVPVREAPVSVFYAPPGERVSNFRPFVDFWRNAATFTRLIVTRLLVPAAVRSRRTPGLLPSPH